MNGWIQEPTEDVAYDEWLRGVLLDDRPADADPAPEAAADSERERIPAAYIRKAIIDELESIKVIRSGIEAKRMCFTGDLHLENLEIRFPLFFMGCVFEGAIRGGGARTRTLSFTGSSLQQGADLRNARIDGHLFMRGPFEAAGPLLLRDIRVDGTLDLRGARFLYDGAEEGDPFEAGARGDCLGLSRAEAAAFLWGRNPPPATGEHRAEVANLAPRGMVTLRDLKVRAFRHDLAEEGALEAWPSRGQLVLDGFTFDRIDDAPRDVLLEWLRRQEAPAATPGKKRWWWPWGPLGRLPSPTPYFQLASVLEKQGCKEDAAHVRAQVRRNEVARYNGPKRFFAHLFFWPVDYGASPRRALWFALGLFAIFFFTIIALGRSGEMAPAADSLVRDPCYYGWQKCGGDLVHWRRVEIASSPPTVRFVPPDYPSLSPFEYTLERFVPVFDFGQREHWEPANAPMRGILTLVAFLGLFLGSLFAAAISGLLKPRQS